MQIRRFIAPTVQAALRQVKGALGADAVILETTTDDQGQVIVAAAVDREEREPGGELVVEVRQLIGLVRELVDGHRREQELDVVPALRDLYRGLVANGMDAVIATALARAAAGEMARGRAIGAALEELFMVPVPDPRVRLLVGPPGDGKTTTIAKLAAIECRAGRRVRLVSADTYRIGGAAELSAYGRALGTPVDRVTSPAELARVLERTADDESVLIDTAGAALASAAELDELAALAEAAGPGAGRTLVLSAVTGSVAAEQSLAAFAPLEPDACVVTKLDAAPGTALLGLAWQRGLPVSHLAAGRRVPDDIELATPARLASRLVAA